MLNDFDPDREFYLKRLRLTGYGLLLSVVLTLTPGCGIELAVLGAAASAASSGSAAYKQGKLVATWLGEFDVVVAAGEAALSEMGFSIYKSDGNALKGEWIIVAYDATGDKVTLTVERKTSELTEFQINVGWFGREPTARLILKRMAVAIGLGVDQDGTGDVVQPVPVYVQPVPADAPEATPQTPPDVPSDDTPDGRPQVEPAGESPGGRPNSDEAAP